VNSSVTFLGITIVFVLFAMMLVLYPLFRRTPVAIRAGRRSINIAVYRDQLKEMEADRANGLLTPEQFDVAKLELEARLAQDAVDSEDTMPVSKGSRRLGAALAVLIPVAAFGLYSLLGNQQALTGAGVAATGPMGSGDIQVMMQKAEDKVKANPDDGQTWMMLANAYSVLNRWPDAIRAYENLVRLSPGEAPLWSHYGEAVALANGRNLEGKPIELVRKALALDPRDQKALELSGVYAFQHKDYLAAVKYWQQLVDLSPANDPYTQQIQSALNQAKEQAGLVPPAATGKLDNLSAPAAQSPVASAGVSGTVAVADKLKGKVVAGDVLFLFARDAKAGGPPLAAVRMDAGRLPAPFTLDDSHAMMSGDTLSGHEVIDLIARISKTGNVMPQPGDLEGEVKAVKMGSEGIKLVIDRLK
jgi:cytochrome c-type biogenesis protein CcmH